MFVIWSVTSFLFEVPSGACADVVDRRLLLVLSAPIYAAGFATWVLWPTYAGFAIGFVLWGLSGALMSGTFEALLYDELTAIDATAAYTGLVGWANTAALAATLAATAVAAPLHALGGYAAVGWVSVGVAGVHGLLAWSLPPARRVEDADETKQFDGGATFIRRYAEMLRGGVHEATRRAPVWHLLVIAAALYGLTAYDEYFPLVAREAGASINEAALLVALTVLGQLAGQRVRRSPGVGVAAGNVDDRHVVRRVDRRRRARRPPARIRRHRRRLRTDGERDDRRRSQAAGRHHRPGSGDRDVAVGTGRRNRGRRDLCDGRVRRVLVRRVHVARDRHPPGARRRRRGPLVVAVSSSRRPPTTGTCRQ